MRVRTRRSSRRWGRGFTLVEVLFALVVVVVSGIWLMVAYQSALYLTEVSQQTNAGLRARGFAPSPFEEFARSPPMAGIFSADLSMPDAGVKNQGRTGRVRGELLKESGRACRTPRG